jgi:hypothetical protein
LSQCHAPWEFETQKALAIERQRRADRRKGEQVAERLWREGVFEMLPRASVDISLIASTADVTGLTDHEQPGG